MNTYRVITHDAFRKDDVKMKISAVIMDWAGTAVDFGCFAPVNTFMKVFEKKGVVITLEETRAPMGMAKRDHIKTILEMPRVTSLWREVLGREWGICDVDELYADFQPLLMETLEQYTDVLDGVLDACAILRSKGIQLGSTTGYTSEMMEVVCRGAKKQGYAPDAMVTSDCVGNYGRPYPYMLFKNLEILGVPSVKQVLKVGDTVSDIHEGLNAGVISVGVLVGSSVMGITREEYANRSAEEKAQLCQRTADCFLSNGAHDVIETMADLPALIDSIENGEGLI